MEKVLVCGSSLRFSMYSGVCVCCCGAWCSCGCIAASCCCCLRWSSFGCCLGSGSEVVGEFVEEGSITSRQGALPRLAHSWIVAIVKSIRETHPMSRVITPSYKTRRTRQECKRKAQQGAINA